MSVEMALEFVQKLNEYKKKQTNKQTKKAWKPERR